jgi:D-alanyl-D-alanine carboxypeptidase
MRFITAIFLIISLASCKNTNNKSVETILASKIDSVLSENNFNGVVLITKDSSEIYSKAIGFSDLEDKRPLLPDDQFVIGSISKQITAVMILRAYENEQIDLDDKIDQYLDISQAWAKEVSIHHLLTHTHGIVAIDQPLEFPQGSRFQYSQLGYELLAQILEKIYQQSFNKLTTDFFKSKGLNNTFHPDNQNYKKLVKGYEEQADGEMSFATNSLQNYAAAGSFISNASDLNKWNQLLHAGKLVKKETLELMKTSYATRVHPIYDTVEYGYGLVFKKEEANIQIGALGYVPGFVTAAYYHPQTKLNLIVLENTARTTESFKKAFKVHTDIMALCRAY